MKNIFFEQEKGIIMIEMAFCILWKIRDYAAHIQNAVHLLGA